MHWFSIGVALLAAGAIIVVGLLYIITPTAMSQTFGLLVPPQAPQVPWWLRLKGTRDVVSGLVVFAILAVGEPKLLGIALLILALIPIGDMTVVLSGKGRAATAFGVHGVTAAVMILGAIPLVAGLA